MIGIVNYGMGNLVSIQNAINYLGKDVKLINHDDEFEQVEKIILPGVGSFKAATEKLAQTGFDIQIKKFASSGRPVLGICLGMQLLGTTGFEGGISKGLDLIPGEIVPFSEEDSELIPFVGFQEVLPKDSNSIWKGISEIVSFYFTHSYKFVPKDSSSIFSTSKNGQNFCSSVSKDHIYGVQFHPELSQVQGLKLLKNFINL